MEDNRIQNQIAIYMTNKKLCEFTDKLKPAPIEYYAHMHAQGEEQADGIRAYSCIGVVLQDFLYTTSETCYAVSKVVRANADSIIEELVMKGYSDLTQFESEQDE